MEKNLDSKGRWRNKIVAFRVSPEEAEQIDACVRLSGLSKQDYITKRLTDREIVVQGNPRVYKALRNQMAEIYEELKRLEKCSEENEELLSTLRLVAETLYGLKGENERQQKKNDCSDCICSARLILFKSNLSPCSDFISSMTCVMIVCKSLLLFSFMFLLSWCIG